jgi:hypothetical protein
MANAEAIGGVHSYILYGEESTYNTAVAVDTHFGLVTNFKPNINNNLKGNRGFVGTSSGGRNVVKFTAGQLDISGTLDFTVTRWHFMEYVLGEVSGSGPYTYDEADVPPSLTVATNIDNPGSGADDQEATYSGFVFDSVSIKSSVGEPVTVSANWKAGKVALDTTLSSAVALPDEDVFNFTGGSIELPSGSAISNIIDSVDITITNNWNMLYGVGSRLTQNALPAARDYSVKVSLKYLDNDLYTAALGAATPTATGSPTEYATLVLTFASGTKSITMTFSEVPMSDFAQMQELNSVIGEDITLTPKSLSCEDDRT